MKSCHALFRQYVDAFGKGTDRCRLGAQHRQPAGRGTDNLPSSEGLHLPLVAGDRAAGVMSLRFHDAAPLSPAQRDLLEAFVRQIALVLDREHLRDVGNAGQVDRRIGTAGHDAAQFRFA